MCKVLIIDCKTINQYVHHKSACNCYCESGLDPEIIEKRGLENGAVCLGVGLKRAKWLKG